jgi:hypothetical protein
MPQPRRRRARGQESASDLGVRRREERRPQPKRLPETDAGGEPMKKRGQHAAGAIGSGGGAGESSQPRLRQPKGMASHARWHLVPSPADVEIARTLRGARVAPAPLTGAGSR